MQKHDHAGHKPDCDDQEQPEPIEVAPNAAPGDGGDDGDESGGGGHTDPDKPPRA